MANTPLPERVRVDHRRMLAALAALEKSAGEGAGAKPPLEQLRGLLDVCDREVARHANLEDDLLFPALESTLLEARVAIEALRREREDVRFILGSLQRLLGEPPGTWRDEQLGVEVHDLAELVGIHVRKEESLVSGVLEHVSPPGAKPKGAGRSPGTHLLLAAAAIALGLAGCNATPSSGPTSLAKLDDGPRAAEADADEAAAARGEKLFQDKGCSACHAFGTKLSGPDLDGVAGRRTARWMESQILYPDRMVKEDPTARALFATHALQMPNLGVKPEEARDIIEYFKHRYHEAEEPDED